jgi:hypothetical protein
LPKERSSDPTFLENESRFREAAWMHLEDALNPTTDDWLLILDADEFIVTRSEGDGRAAIEATIAWAMSESCDHIELPVAEVFDAKLGQPLVRIDGQWGQIRADRLVRWHPHATFADKRLAGGSIPKMPGPALRAGDPTILHAGHRREADRRAKHVRYSQHAGHGSAHVKSILDPPRLEAWSTPLPKPITDALVRAS